MLFFVYLTPYLITNISNAHIGNYNSINDIVSNKSAIYSSLPKYGVAFIDADCKYLKNIKLNSNIITFGLKNDADYFGKISFNKNKCSWLRPQSVPKEDLNCYYTFAVRFMHPNISWHTFRKKHVENLFETRAFTWVKRNNCLERISHHNRAMKILFFSNLN